MYIYNTYKAKLKNELTPSRKETKIFTITLSFFFLLIFRTCVLDHRILALFCDQRCTSESLEEKRKIM